MYESNPYAAPKAEVSPKVRRGRRPILVGLATIGGATLWAWLGGPLGSLIVIGSILAVGSWWTSLFWPRPKPKADPAALAFVRQLQEPTAGVNDPPTPTTSPPADPEGTFSGR